MDLAHISGWTKQRGDTAAEQIMMVTILRIVTLCHMFNIVTAPKELVTQTFFSNKYKYKNSKYFIFVVVSEWKYWLLCLIIKFSHSSPGVDTVAVLLTACQRQVKDEGPGVFLLCLSVILQTIMPEAIGFSIVGERGENLMIKPAYYRAVKWEHLVREGLRGTGGG